MVIIALTFILFPLLTKNNFLLNNQSDYELQTSQQHKNEFPTKPLRNIGLATLLFFIVPSTALLLYFKWGDSAQVAQLLIAQQSALQEQQMRAQLGSPQQVILQLKQHLQINPDSAEGWYLLGRLYESQQQLNDASLAFAKALQLAPHNIDILLNYAETLALQNNEQITEQAANLLREVLILQPDNNDALNLIAIYAYQHKDYQTAIKNWEIILPRLTPNSADQQNVLQAIEKARSFPSPRRGEGAEGG